MKIPRTPLALPPLPYPYDGLEPVTSLEALKIHYEGHHGGYVRKFNELLRNGGSQADLEFNYSGHILHTHFWESFNPHNSQPGPSTQALIRKHYPGLYPVNTFVNDLVGAAMRIKGSGWAIAVLDRRKLKIVSIANHNLRDVIHFTPLLLLDAWEHNYYLDYANKKSEYFNAIVDLIDWNTFEKNLIS